MEGHIVRMIAAMVVACVAFAIAGGCASSSTLIDNRLPDQMVWHGIYEFRGRIQGVRGEQRWDESPPNSIYTFYGWPSRIDVRSEEVAAQGIALVDNTHDLSLLLWLEADRSAGSAADVVYTPRSYVYWLPLIDSTFTTEAKQQRVNECFAQIRSGDLTNAQPMTGSINFRFKDDVLSIIELDIRSDGSPTWTPQEEKRSLVITGRFLGFKDEPHWFWKLKDR